MANIDQILRPRILYQVLGCDVRGSQLRLTSQGTVPRLMQVIWVLLTSLGHLGTVLNLRIYSCPQE